MVTDFVFETVLSAPDKMDFIRRAGDAGFFIRLFFVGTDDPSINAKRVAMRVMEGGHDVPIPKIIGRYTKSLAYFGETPQPSKPIQVTVTPESYLPVTPEPEPCVPATDTAPPQQHPSEETRSVQPGETQNPVGSVDQTEIADPPRAKGSGTSIFGRFWKRLGF